MSNAAAKQYGRSNYPVVPNTEEWHEADPLDSDNRYPAKKAKLRQIKKGATAQSQKMSRHRLLPTRVLWTSGRFKKGNVRIAYDLADLASEIYEPDFYIDKRIGTEILGIIERMSHALRGYPAGLDDVIDRLDLALPTLPLQYPQLHQRAHIREPKRAVSTFEPSNRLAQYLIIAMDELRSSEEQNLAIYSEQLRDKNPRLIEEIEKSLSDVDQHYQIDQAKEHLRKSIKRLLGTLGGGLQDMGIREYLLTARGEFVLNVRNAILERILIRPYDAKDFLDLLYQELKPVALSEQYGGAWGKLCLRDDQLWLMIKPIEMPQRTPWKQAVSR